MNKLFQSIIKKKNVFLENYKNIVNKVTIVINGITMIHGERIIKKECKQDKRIYEYYYKYCEEERWNQNGQVRSIQEFK